MLELDTSITRKFACECTHDAELCAAGGGIDEVDAAGFATEEEEVEEGGLEGALCEMLRWRMMGEGGRATKGGGCEMRPRLERKMRMAVRSCGAEEEARGEEVSRLRAAILCEGGIVRGGGWNFCGDVESL